MTSAEQNRQAPENGAVPQPAALCIVGAGIAGMNALFAASRYLGPDDTVVLIDRNDAPGGMWTQTYGYVRLHQPHRMFTAGDIAWHPRRPPAYLATKEEVLEHFAVCLDELRRRVTLVEYYGYDVVGIDESHDGVRITATPVGAGKPRIAIDAERCIKAYGFRVPQIEPLEFSSDAVRSLAPASPDLLETADDHHSPIYVVGGGKTGMDTAHALIRRFPGAAIHLVVGRGTIFASRDKGFPAGWRRWFGSATTLEYFLRLLSDYDGTNGADIFERFKAERSEHLPGTGSQYMFGVLSRAENEAINNGVREVLNEYVDDVVDGEDGPVLVFRSGGRRAVPPQTLFVNCTGHVMRQDYPYEPFLSTGGRIVSVQPTSGIHFLTTFAAYFLTHLFYLGELGRLPVYEMNYQALLRKDKVAFPFAAMTQVLYNVIVIMQAVPTRVMAECGLDFDRWFPLPRRLLGVIRLRRGAKHYEEHFRTTLDRVARIYGIECGPLARRA